MHSKTDLRKQYMHYLNMPKSNHQNPPLLTELMTILSIISGRNTLLSKDKDPVV